VSAAQFLHPPHDLRRGRCFLVLRTPRQAVAAGSAELELPRALRFSSCRSPHAPRLACRGQLEHAARKRCSQARKGGACGWAALRVKQVNDLTSGTEACCAMLEATSPLALASGATSSKLFTARPLSRTTAMAARPQLTQRLGQRSRAAPLNVYPQPLPRAQARLQRLPQRHEVIRDLLPRLARRLLAARKRGGGEAQALDRPGQRRARVRLAWGWQGWTAAQAMRRKAAALLRRIGCQGGDGNGVASGRNTACGSGGARTRPTARRAWRAAR
jgi:hypothetical protein